MRRPGRPVGSCRRCSTFSGRAAFRAKRVELRLSHGDLADLLAAAGATVTARAVCGWELGEYCPDESRLPVLARVLGVRVDRIEAWFWPGSSRQATRQSALPLAGADAARRGDVEPPAAKRA